MQDRSCNEGPVLNFPGPIVQIWNQSLPPLQEVCAVCIWHIIFCLAGDPARIDPASYSGLEYE